MKMREIEKTSLLQSPDFITARYNGMFFPIGYWSSICVSLKKICAQAAIISLNTKYFWSCIQNAVVQIYKGCISVHISDIYVGRGAIPGAGGSASNCVSIYGQSAAAFILSRWPDTG
jgi:hypothetical protein